MHKIFSMHNKLMSQVAISGATRLVWIVGDPVDHLSAPALMNDWLVRHGQNCVVVPVHVSAGDLKDVFGAARRLHNLDGCIITAPHKLACAQLVDELLPAARMSGAVNAVRFRQGRAYGDLLDGTGFVQGLAERGYVAGGKRALMIGAGGVGSAIARALAQEGLSRLLISDAEPARAEALASRLNDQKVGVCHAEAAALPLTRDVLAEVDLLINATPIGMGDDARSPLPLELLRSDLVVADVIMSPPMTPLLRAAQALGCEVHPGTQVLKGQLDRLLGFFC